VQEVDMVDNSIVEELLKLNEDLIEALWDAWREGASDAHTTGEDEHWRWTDAFKKEEEAKAKIRDLRERIGP
jgi:hypothetical protein